MSPLKLRLRRFSASFVPSSLQICQSKKQQQQQQHRNSQVEGAGTPRKKCKENRKYLNTGVASNGNMLIKNDNVRWPILLVIKTACPH